MDFSTQQLRQQILSLAIQGKLVPQIAEEGNAQDLLHKIEAERKKSNPKYKSLPPVTDEEEPFEIPESWVWCRIGDIFSHSAGKQLSGKGGDGKPYKYITTSNLYWGRFELEHLKEMNFTDAELERCSAHKGDLLVCEGGDIGRSAIWNYDYDILLQNHVHRLRPILEEFCVKFFYFIMYFYKSTSVIGGKGIGIQGLSANTLKNISVPLPPLAEQKRIVEKLEELLGELDTIEQTKEQIEHYAEQLQGQILQTAIQGKLVPQIASEGNAADLLNAIRKEKAQLIKAGKLKKEKPLPPITDEEKPFDIPESWEWVRLGEIEEINLGFTYRPHYVDKGVAFLSIKDISKGFIDFSNVQHVTQETYDNAAYGSKPQRGDILYGRVGTIGKPQIIETDIPFCIFVSLGFFRDHTNILNKKYICHWMNSYLFSSQVDMKVSGTTLRNLNTSWLRDFLIPLPPLFEQKRIVAKLEELLGEVEKLKR